VDEVVAWTEVEVETRYMLHVKKIIIDFVHL